MENLLHTLNPEQLEAVQTTEGYVRVIACAGSGKTRALTARYVYLVHKLGINPANILCVTFTNKAANEMRDRVKRLVGDTDYGYICTYHGFCVKVLREDIHNLEYPKTFIILDVTDQKTMLREIYHEMSISAHDITFKEILTVLSHYKFNNQETYVEYLVYDKGINIDLSSPIYRLSAEKIPLVEEIVRQYLQKQRKYFALDFDDLIYFTFYIFTHDEAILLKWQSRLHYIQVDEFQDTSYTQFLLMTMLSAKHNNLFVVGDPDQNIYGWRGAKPGYLVDFDKGFPDVKTVIMNRNYRSTKHILGIANSIIKENTLRVDKDMVTDNDDGVDVLHFHAKSDTEEADFITKRIKQIVKQSGVKYSDIAVLYRAHFVSRMLEKSFVREGLPYVIWGGIRFFERQEIKDIVSYLRLIAYDDDISFLRVINTPSRKLGNVFIDEIKDTATKQNISMFEALKSKGNSYKRKEAVEFVYMILEFRRAVFYMSVSDLVKFVLSESGLENMYRRDGDEDRLDNLTEFVASIIERERSDADPLTLKTYLQEISLLTSVDENDSRNDRVKLMTIHTAKGLEFPYVFLCSFSEGILPNYRSIISRKKEAMEEERRLAYVAITRAEKELYLTESEGYNHQAHLEKRPSRFLLRLPEELYVREGVIPKELLEEYPQNLEEECQQYALKINDKIQHPVFGEGFISVIDPGRRLYEVYFYKLADSRQLNFDFVNNLCRLADKLNEKSVDYVESEVPDSFVPNCVEQHAEMEAETKDEAPIAAIGKKVSHPDFGIGTIVSVNSEKTAYVISFLIDGESKQFEFAYDLLKPKKKENILL